MYVFLTTAGWRKKTEDTELGVHFAQVLYVYYHLTGILSF